MVKSILLIAIFFSSVVYAQEGEDPIGENRKTMILDTILICLNDEYVYPENVQIISDSLTHFLKIGRYSAHIAQSDYVDALSIDLRRISKDRHLSLKVVKNLNDAGGRQQHSLTSEQVRAVRNKNFYFKNVELLSGNIGYLRFDRFANPELAAKTVSAAMQFLENCDAIIIDLRFNYGGEEEMVKYIASHFFKESTLMNSRNFTRRNSVVESWTDTSLFVEPLGSSDLYLLTGNGTASGAEAFSYGLQNHKRAVVIGARTAGAAHWVEYFHFPSLQLEIKVPVAYPSHPKTDTNWEGVGVTPNIQISEKEAFDRAYVLALDSLINKETDKTNVEELAWYRRIASLKLDSQGLNTFVISDYVGHYDGIEMIEQEGDLCWDQGDNQIFVLIPIADDHFLFADGDDFIVKFARDDKGFISGYQLMSGGKDTFKLHLKAKGKEGIFRRIFK